MTARFLLAIKWMLATTLAVVVAHLAVEIVGAALLGLFLIFLLPFIGGVVGGLPVGLFQWFVLRRRVDSRLWILFTVIGFFGAWTVAIILAAVAFVPHQGLDQWRAFFCFAIPTPIIGLAQSAVLRRWTSHTWMWVVASAIGWGTFFAIEIFGRDTLSVVNQPAGRLVSAIAGWEVASSVGATLLGGALAGGITGIALAVALQDHEQRA